LIWLFSSTFSRTDSLRGRGGAAMQPVRAGAACRHARARRTRGWHAPLRPRRHGCEDSDAHEHSSAERAAQQASAGGERALGADSKLLGERGRCAEEVRPRT